VAAPAVVGYVLLTEAAQLHHWNWESKLLAATVIAALAYATFASKGEYLARSAYTLLAVLYIGKLISYFVIIRNIPDLGVQLTIFVIFVTAFTDIFAMLVGITLGRTPLTRLSPRKTVEGALGGLMAGTA